MPDGWTMDLTLTATGPPSLRVSDEMAPEHAPVTTPASVGSDDVNTGLVMPPTCPLPQRHSIDADGNLTAKSLPHVMDSLENDEGISFVNFPELEGGGINSGDTRFSRDKDGLAPPDIGDGDSDKGTGHTSTSTANALSAGAGQTSFYSSAPISDEDAEARKRRRIRFTPATQTETDAGAWKAPTVNATPDAASPESKDWRGVIIESVHHDDSDYRSVVRATYPTSEEGDVATATRATSLLSAQKAKRRIDEGEPIDWTGHAEHVGSTPSALPTNRVRNKGEDEATAANPDDGIVAAREAPTVEIEWLGTDGRPPALLLVPIAHTGSEACAMITLQKPDAIFGSARDELRGGAEQGATLAACLTGGIETQYAAPTSFYGANDAIVLVPWATRPTVVARSAAQLELAREAGNGAIWCTLDALHNHVAYHAVSLAFQRLAALTTVGEHGEQRAGIWEYARPIVSTRTAHEWATRANAPPDKVMHERTSFLKAEQARGQELRARLIALDSGSGRLIAMADSVRTATDYADEIPFPAIGLPGYADIGLRLTPFAERPLHLSTTWLARLPPQQVPPGFKPLAWHDILRTCARRNICAALNATADRDFECWETGGSARRRPPYVCIGQGGGKEIKHADGIGTYNALSIVWEFDTATGLYDMLDFQRPGRTHWTLEYLKNVFGIHDDQQLLSLVMHGVRWGVQAPMQIRIAANLERLDDRIRGVGEAFRKLIAKGLYYKYKKLRRASEQISPDGPGPLLIIPSFIVGTGGTDKPDNPAEKRIVGDQGAPHADQRVRERNKPHGEPEGPIAVSMNDMMGPEPGSVPRGRMLDATRYPMPHPEVKVRPRQAYGDSAVLSHMAHVNNTYMAGFKSDGRHMFFQFEMAPEEERTCCFTVITPFQLTDDSGKPILDENGDAIFEPWFTLIVATCMNMGSRNASKVAQRFTDRLLEAFSQQLDIYVRDSWMQHQTPELQVLLAERSARLGHRQARPFKTSGYTDDYEFEFVGPDLFAAGARTWIDMCAKANYWLSDKASAGTVVDFIGGRLVLNGGFGCLSPSKHARAIADSLTVCEGTTITREALESHNSFLVHVHDWLDFPAGTLKGLSAPLRTPGTPEQHAVISDKVREQHKRIIDLLHTRQMASFWSGVHEATRGQVDSDGAKPALAIFSPRFSSDACSDVAQPFICGVCNGLYFRYPLDGDWRRRHITITEACGTVLTLMILAEYFPMGEIMLESDATASLATARATTAADDLIYLRRRAEQVERFRVATRRAWITHCKGWANGLADAGSRNKMDEMHALASAFGIRLREVPIPPEAHAFMRDVLANSSEVDENEEAHDTSLGTHNLSMTGDMPIAHPTTMTLLTFLHMALERGEAEVEVTRRAIAVAAHAGATRRTIMATNSVIAACLCIMQPYKYGLRKPTSVADAARACGCSEAGCRKWLNILRKKIHDEQTPSAMDGSSSTIAPEDGAQPSTGEHQLEIATIDALLLIGQPPNVLLNLQPAPPSSSTPTSIPPSPPPERSPCSVRPHGSAEAKPSPLGRQSATVQNVAGPIGEEDLLASWLVSATATDGDSGAEEQCPERARRTANANATGRHGAGLLDIEAATDEIYRIIDDDMRFALEAVCCNEDMDASAANTLFWQEGSGAQGNEEQSPDKGTNIESPDTRLAEYAEPWQDLPDLEEALASHNTSMGRHNLSMMGDMPIAHGKDRADATESPCPDPHFARRVAPRRAHTKNIEETSPESIPVKRPRTFKRAEPAAVRPSPESGQAVAPRRPDKRTAAAASHDGDEDLIGALAKRRSPRKIKAGASTADIDDVIEAHPTRARASSPQPETAADARRWAARDVAKRLIEHDSIYALCPDRPEVLLGVVVDAAAAREAGIPRGTASADEWGFQWVRKFGIATNNRWMRPRAAPSAEDILCEVWFAILALVWIAQMIAPSTRRKMAGYGQGMPTSALLALYGWRRVMLSCGRYVADLAQVRSVLKGVCARYKARWGDDAFVRTLKQPFTTEHLMAIIALLESATRLATWSAVLRKAVLTAFCYALSTGARKDEWTASFEGDTFVRRSNFNWVDERGNDLPNTAATVSSRKNGDLLRGRSAPSKCDRLNVEWGARDMWFRYDDRNPLNFAWRWRQWEEAHPCPASERARCPAFSPTGDSRPFTGSQADGVLRVLLSLVMTATEAAQRSWHSCRITLATRLFARRGEASGIARDEVEGVIQSLVRWKTVEAMRIYARMQPTQYADYVDMATDPRSTTGGAIPEDLPEVDPEGILAETQATIDAIDSEEAIKTKAARTAREQDVPRATTKRGQRRAAPPTGGVSTDAAEPEARRHAFDIGEGQAVYHLGDDSWNVTGQQLRVHNSFWGWTDNEYSECRVAGYAGEYSFASGKLSKHTYVIEYDGHFYPATHTTVAGALIDATVKRRIKKAPAPRLL